MNKIIYTLLFFTSIVLTSCTKIINIDLNNAAPVVVIEGTITNETPAEVSITQSVNFSKSNVFPPISGATVQIKDNNGNVFPLTEVSAGMYRNNTLFGQSGGTYQLMVTANGKQFTASSTMPKQVTLDTLLFEKIAFGSEAIWIVKPQYTDPDGFGNYYRFIEKINNVRNPTIWVWDDRINNNGISTRPLIQGDSTINLNDTIEVEMNCLDKPIFRYFRGLQDLQQQSATPANPETNITGGAVGYFSAHTRQRRKQTVQ